MAARNIKLVDRKFLWGRSGGRCAFEGCEAELVEEMPESGRGVVLAQECHIVASSDDGPRGDPSFPEEERDTYTNLILLCLKHHKIVDDDPHTWSADRLRRMKKDHEARVAEAMGAVDRRRLTDELIYAETVSAWVERGQLDEWDVWTSHLLAPRPSIYQEDFERLQQLRRWLLNRPWPGRFEGLEGAFQNFRRAADDLAMVVAYATSPWGDDQRMIDTFYKAEWFPQDVYDRLAEQFEWIVHLIHDMVFELTRAANRVSDEVRSTLDFRFRLEEGDAFIERQGAGLYSDRFVPRYRGDEIDNIAPYRDLREFCVMRSNRDIHFGEGVDEDALRRVTPIRIEELGLPPPRP